MREKLESADAPPPHLVKSKSLTTASAAAAAFSRQQPLARNAVVNSLRRTYSNPTGLLTRMKQNERGAPASTQPRGKENKEAVNPKSRARIVKPVRLPRKEKSSPAVTASSSITSQEADVATAVSSSGAAQKDNSPCHSGAPTVCNSPALSGSPMTAAAARPSYLGLSFSPSQLTARLTQAVVDSFSPPAVRADPQDDVGNSIVQQQPTAPTPPISNNKSPGGYLTSKNVPDLHRVLLGKMRRNQRKAKSLVNSPNRSPCKAPLPLPQALDERKLEQREDETEEEKEVFEGTGESDSSVGSVSSSRPGSSCSERNETPDPDEMDRHFRDLFNRADTYMTGMVSSNKLMDHLLGLVDFPKLDRWKIEELRRQLDPRNDDRMVDEALFIEVGRRWAEMVIDPDSHAMDQDVGHQSLIIIKSPESGMTVDRGNTSCGSVEGVGGWPGCDSREVELENRCSELRYQLNRANEDNAELQQALASTEDTVLYLTQQLEAARSRPAVAHTSEDKSTNKTGRWQLTEAADRAADEEEGGVERERVARLTSHLDQMEEKYRLAALQLQEAEAKCEELRREAAVAHRREQTATAALAAKQGEVNKLLEEIDRGAVLLSQVEGKRLEIEQELEITSRTLFRLEEERGAAANTSSIIQSSHIHDVSVDDKVFEDQLSSCSSSNSCSPNPRKILLVTPLKRGPSASSTPTRGGSIGEELKEMVSANSNLPSPLCEKEEGRSRLQLPLLQDLTRWQEAVRRAIIEEAEPAVSGRLISALNRAMEATRADMLARHQLQQEDSEEEEENGEVAELRAEVERLQQQLATEREERGWEARRLADVETVETRLVEMVALLQAANKALIAVGQSASGEQSRPSSPELSLEDREDLMNNWQLDLEGIELVEWNNNLSRRLLQYSRLLKEERTNRLEDTGGEEELGPMPRLWLSSLFSRLDDLHVEAERSRDLLLLAGDSIRETEAPLSAAAVPLIPPPRFPKTQATQTDALPPPMEEQEETGMEKKRSSGRVWSWLVGLVGSILVLVLMLFLLGGELEYEGRVYRPITCYPLRWLSWLSAPLPAIRVKREVVVW